MKTKLVLSFIFMIAVVFAPILLANENALFYEIKESAYTEFQLEFVRKSEGSISFEKLIDGTNYLYIDGRALCYTVDSIIVVGNEILVRLNERGNKRHLIQIGTWDYMDMLVIEVLGERILEFPISN